MTDLKQFCLACGDESGLIPTKTTIQVQVRGEQIDVTYEVGRCTRCGIEVNDPNVDPTLLAYSIYRKKNDLLTPEEIVEKRKRYRLSQKSLALLFGMSEATINRYERGALQDTVHDNMLRFLDRPQVVLDAIARRGKLLSDEQRTAATDAALNEMSARVEPLSRPARWKTIPTSQMELYQSVQMLIFRAGSTWGARA